MTVVYRKADINDLPALLELSCRLWPHHTADEMLTEYRKGIANSEAAFFLAYAGETPIGFAQCQLRHDYVEGTSSSPVGYLEGIYVLPDHRHEGVAKQLLKECERWAKSKGCSEFASDCELTNTESLQFHLNVGFEEANRIICFTKQI